MKKRWLAYGFLAVSALTMVVSPVLAKNGMKEGKNATPIVDLTTLLAPPPTEDSAQGQAELKEVLAYQASRTKAQEAQCQADAEKSVFRFQDVMGDKFTAENLPLTAALFDEVVKKTKATVGPAKDFFNHPRPFVNHSQVNPCLAKENEGSYPSNHATIAAVCAVLLSNMVPEKSAAIYQRAWAYSLNRVIGGVHYPSDIQAGRISGTVIAYALMKDKKFMKEFGPAKAELRTALGY